LSRRCCSVGQVRVWSISVTLLVLWCRLQAYLAARRWTISILLRCSAVWGSQTDHAYSSFGRTRDRYACDFIFVLEVLRFLFKNPRLLFALTTILFVCCVHFKSNCEEWFQDILLLKKLIPKYDCVASFTGFLLSFSEKVNLH
jgi:hypothetical protein